MGNLDFISDVIYGLKMDMGQVITVGVRSSTSNLATGNTTFTEDTFTIPNAIYLPLNLRAQFLRSIGIHKEGYLESGNREILIDADDIPAGKSLLNQKGFVVINNKKADIVSVDDFQHAFIVTIKQVTGL